MLETSLLNLLFIVLAVPTAFIILCILLWVLSKCS